jgi:hypothetical protein
MQSVGESLVGRIGTRLVQQVSDAPVETNIGPENASHLSLHYHTAGVFYLLKPKPDSEAI